MIHPGAIDGSQFLIGCRHEQQTELKIVRTLFLCQTLTLHTRQLQEAKGIGLPVSRLPPSRKSFTYIWRQMSERLYGLCTGSVGV